MIGFYHFFIHSDYFTSSYQKPMFVHPTTKSCTNKTLLGESTDTRKNVRKYLCIRDRRRIYRRGRISQMLRDLQPRTRLAHRTCLPSYQAFQASRIRDAFIASEVEQGMCRTLISLFPQSLTTEPLKPGEGRVQELEEGESYSYKHAGFSSSVAHALVAVVQHCTRLLER